MRKHFTPLSALTLCICLAFSNIGNAEIPKNNTLITPKIVTLPDDDKRYLALLLLNYGGDEFFGLEDIRKAAEYGCNSLQLCIAWDQVYINANSPATWAKYDNQIRQALAVNMKIAIRIMVGRDVAHTEGFWNPDDAIRDGLGRVARYNAQTYPSLAHQPSVERAKVFVREVVQRYAYLREQNKLLCVSVVQTSEQESGHGSANYDGDNRLVRTVFDYSEPNKAGFRSWLFDKYAGNIQSLNRSWSSDFSRFDDIQPPYNSGTIEETFQFTSGRDWYVYQHTKLKAYTDQMIDNIKSVDSNIRVINEYGSVWDNASQVRISLGFKNLGLKADGVKINNSYNYPNRFSTDIVRSNIAPGKWVGSEVFFGDQGRSQIQDYYNQINEQYEHGSKFIAFVFSGVHQIEEAKNVLLDMSKKWLTTPFVPVTGTSTVSYKMSELVFRNYVGSGVYGRWKDAYDNTQKPVEIKLIEDWLGEEGNLPPRLNRSIDPKTATLKRPFTFQLPDDTFTDDGVIVSYQVTGLPMGMSYSNKVISGRPTQIGEFTIQVKGVDDFGATTTTEFRLTVKRPTQGRIQSSLYRSGDFRSRQFIKNLSNNDTLYASLLPFDVNIFADIQDRNDVLLVVFDLSGPVEQRQFETDAPFALWGDNSGQKLTPGDYKLDITAYATDQESDDIVAAQTLNFKVIAKKTNQIPVLQNQIANQLATRGRAFSFLIPSSTFNDPDGRISNVRITNLPNGMSANGMQIRGTPTRVGSSTVRVFATDDEGAEIETQFVITVQESIQAPVITKPIPDQVAVVNQLFDYTIPENTFSDSDGQIVKIQTTGLPAGLRSVFYRIVGVPTRVGTHNVRVRVFDNQGIPAEVSFKITVIKSEMDFDLLRAGGPNERGYLGTLFMNNKLYLRLLPARINIYASSNKPIDRVVFDMTGPVNHKSEDNGYPFGLYGDNGGFEPKVGTYQLTTTAYFKGAVVEAGFVRFEILDGGSVPVRLSAETANNEPEAVAWEVYPNPFQDFVNVSLPAELSTQIPTCQIISISGTVSDIRAEYISVSGRVLTVALHPLQLKTGMYFLKINGADQTHKLLKIQKE